MKELLLENKKKDINSSSINERSDSSILFNNADSVYTALRYPIGKQSCYKRRLSIFLSKLYSCQILIIILSLIFGLICFGIPMLCVYYSFIPNIFLSILIICFIAFFISLLFIIIACIDSKIYRYTLSAKWERKSLVKHIRDLFIILFLVASLIFCYFFYENILNDSGKKIRFDFQLNKDSEELLSDFVFKYLLYMSLFDMTQTFEVRNNHIKLISDDWDINNLRNILRYICIPIMILCFFTIVKFFLIDIRQTIEKIICFGGIFVLFTFQCYLSSNAIDDLKIKNSKISSYFQCIIILIILFGYILWTINHSLVLFKKRKDKNFAIRRYNLLNLILFVCFDIITCCGFSIIVISILYSFVTFLYKGETYKHLYYANKILKIGFMPAAFGNSFYFGYYFMAKIFRPISIEFAPYELKNKFYIKAKNRLRNYLSRFRKTSLKEKIKLIIDK